MTTKKEIKIEKIYEKKIIFSNIKHREVGYRKYK